MILPDKNRQLRYSILGISSFIMEELSPDQTISSLWEKIRVYQEINTYEKFVLGLDFLYTLDLIEFKDGVIKKKND